MSDYVNDYDRVELLKKWWDEHGSALIIGLVLGLVVIFAWQFWQKKQALTQVSAASAYQTLVTMSLSKDTDLYITRAQSLIKTYPRSPYAVLSSFLLSHAEVVKGNYEAAYQANEWVMKHADDVSFKQIARIRAARLRLAQHEPDQALALLNTVDDPNFAILTDEVKGDIYVVKHDFNAAKKAYIAAEQDAPDSPVLLPVLQLKLSSLPQASKTLPATH